MIMQKKVIPGKYRHYKGKDYQVYGVVKHSETEETLVLYRPLYGSGELWVRPIDAFCDNVQIDGEEIPRFNLLSKSDSSVAFE